VRKKVLAAELATQLFHSAGADFIFIPENPPEARPWEDDMCEIIKRVSVRAIYIPQDLNICLHSIENLASVKPL
jgi:hypothetical protein